MKKLVLIILSVLAFTGLSVAQDVWYCGYYTNGSNYQNGAVYKNNNKIHDYQEFNSNLQCEAVALTVVDNDIYWAVNCMNAANGYYEYAAIAKNEDYWMETVSTGHINDMIRSVSTVYAVGSMVISGVQRAVAWMGSTNSPTCSSTPYYTMGNTSYDSEAFAAALYEGHLYVVGVQYTSYAQDSYIGKLWKDGVEQTDFGNNFKPTSIDIGYGGAAVVSGEYREGSTTQIKVYHDLISTIYWGNTTFNPGEGVTNDVCYDDEIWWLTGRQGNQLKVWELGTQQYSHTVSAPTTSAINCIKAYPEGVFYGGAVNGSGKIWKDGTVLYSPSNCQNVLGLYVPKPSCSTSFYNLPFTDDFEYGSTHWTCWTPNTYARRVSLFENGAYGNESVYIGASGPTGDMLYHSPKLVIPSGGNVTLSFASMISVSTGSYPSGGCSVWISTANVPLPGTFTDQVWAATTNNNNNWETVTVDLSAYQGQTISLGFKLNNPNTTKLEWYLDDVSVTQSAPTQYTITVNANNNAWGTVSGGGQYNAGATCTLHATPASGYQFDSWKKNGNVVSTNPNYSFTVTENATYTAYFSQTPVTYYTITTNVTPSGSGTVTGGGTYPAGSTVTLEAIPNNGYAFSQWQDGSTSNPRTITVNGDATYTATFTQLQYTITTSVSPAGAGTVTGGGAYHYGETCTLTATANSGYEFQGWQDGNTQNPRSFTVTGNAAYTAIFSEVGATYYTVTASVSPAGAGTVTGTGTYEAGSVITLHAVANQGYTFDHWSDNSTQNPRTITVNSNMNFTAYFTQNQYTITVIASPSNGGMVSGGGAYYYGDYATLTATPYSGYEFVGWSDGSSEPVHQVLVTGNATYTATFTQAGTTYYTVTTYVSPNGAGTVTGAGTYPAGATATLSATANQGYTFNRWNDGSTSNPRTVTVNNNMSFTAYFTTNQYTITVNANPSNGGTVTGGGTYNYGATATLTATPANGYQFLQWSDGNTNSTRYITVTQNATNTALFLQAGGTVYTLTVTPNYPLLGQTFGSGTYPAGSSVEIAAYPSEYAVFVQWNDGNTQNPRTVVVNSKVEYIAEFRAANHYVITVESANPSMGEAYGGGTFFEGAVTEISAIPYAGYVFTGWNDGNTQNPRTITVTGNATYTANFSENSVVTHTLTVICNTDQGTVSGGGIYMHGATAVIQAFPNQGYVFTKWSDENTENPRIVTVNNDMALVAFFATGVDESLQSNLKLYPNPAKSSIHIAGLETDSEVRIYNSLGELVKVVSVGADQEISVRDLASGLYLVRCGSATLRFVKEQ